MVWGIFPQLRDELAHFDGTHFKCMTLVHLSVIKYIVKRKL